MFSFRTTSLLEQGDLTLHRGNIALLSNQSAWNPQTGEYLLETLHKRYNLKKVFIPKGGLFSSISDSSHREDYSTLKSQYPNVEFVQLFDNEGYILSFDALAQLAQVDALIIEMQDMGVRYCPVTRSIYALFSALKKADIELSIYLIDRFNSSPRVVEGVPSKVDDIILGIPNKHGLTIGEIATLFHSELNAKFALHIISANTQERVTMPWSIPISEDVCGLFTSNFYCGQYLWNGTNISCGIGTTRPYERFGAPFLSQLIGYNSDNQYDSWNDPDNPISEPSLVIRWEQFIPHYGKYQNQSCFGFQLLINPSSDYHSYLHALRVIKFLKENVKEFEFNPLIRELIADSTILSYLEGNSDLDIKEYVKTEEQKWIRKAKKYLLYDEQPYRIK